MTRYLPHVIGGAVLLAGLYLALSTSYRWAFENGWNAANVRAERVIGEFREAEKQASERARKAERAEAAAIIRAADEYERGKTDAQETADRIVADLRAGNLRLRQHWQGCAATSELSGAAAGAIAADAAAQLRAAGAGDLVRLADQCDAHVRGLQAVVRAR